MKARRTPRLEVIPLETIPEIRAGADLAREVAAALVRENLSLRTGDIVVLTQKIVSKAEGRLVDLRKVRPSATARAWARRLRADPRQVECILRETRRIIRFRGRVLIAETRHGFVCANAGVDRSNIPGRHFVACLPRHPDASARRFAAAIRRRLGVPVAVIITDTWGRPWRVGQVNFAIGAAGLRVLRDLRGHKDRSGNRLHATLLAVADELSAAAGLVMGKTSGVPVVIIRGARFTPARDSARRLLRPAAQDLFR